MPQIMAIGQALVAILPPTKGAPLDRAAWSARSRITPQQLNAGYFSGVSWLPASDLTLLAGEQATNAWATALSMTRAVVDKFSLDPNLHPSLIMLSPSAERNGALAVSLRKLTESAPTFQQAAGLLAAAQNQSGEN